MSRAKKQKREATGGNGNGAAPVWRNRIVGSGVVQASKLLSNPRNYRLHPKNQQQALNGVLDQVGWVQSVIVNKQTGFVVDGHMRVSLAIARGESVPVSYVDLTAEEENLILASLDPLSGFALNDSEKFGALLRELEVGDSTLDELLNSCLTESEKTSLRPDAGKAGKRNLGDRDAQIKPVLYAKEVAIFEAAILASGERNRGKALIDICRFYLERKRKEGQLDVRAEMSLETWRPDAH